MSLKIKRPFRCRYSRDQTQLGYNFEHLPYFIACFVILSHKLTADFVRKRGFLGFCKFKFLDRPRSSRLMPPNLASYSIHKKESGKEDLFKLLASTLSEKLKSSKVRKNRELSFLSIREHVFYPFLSVVLKYTWFHCYIFSFIEVPARPSCANSSLLLRNTEIMKKSCGVFEWSVFSVCWSETNKYFLYSLVQIRYCSDKKLSPNHPSA